MGDEGDGGAVLYLQIAEQLARRIRSGDLPAGALLPSQDALAASTGAAKGTVRKATDLLRALGVVESRPGGGLRVTGVTPPIPLRPPDDPLQQLRAEFDAYRAATDARLEALAAELERLRDS